MTLIQNHDVTRVIRGGRGPMGPQGAGLRAWQTKTDDYTAVDGDRLVLDSAAGAFTVTMPAGGGEVWIRSVGDVLSTNAVALEGNGKTIEGAASLALDGDAAGFLIHFTSQGSAWLYDLTFQHGAA